LKVEITMSTIFGYVGRVEPTAISPGMYPRLARVARDCEDLPMFRFARLGS
jgi:hypothetical protein